ncbi:MAG: nucleotidyltransferase family protein [Candidatus Paceibacteria bacterium]
MKSIEEIKKVINEHKPFLRERFKVKSLGIFGSSLRGEQTEASDIDILVEFSETIDLFDFIDLEDFLSKILGRKVDLVMKDTLKPRIKNIILSEAVAV